MLAVPNSEVGRTARKRRDKQSELNGLTEEIAALEVVAGELRQKVGEDALRAEIKRALGFRLREMEDWKRIVQAFVALAHARTTWGQNMREADEHTTRIDHGGVLAGAPHLIDEWLTAARSVVQPVPIDFTAMIEKLVEASADPHGSGTR